MTCHNHPGTGTAAVCANCGKECCAACVTRVGDKDVCRDCADTVRSQLPPEPVEQMPEESVPPVTVPEESAPVEKAPEAPQPETMAPAETTTTLPAISRPTGMSVQPKSSYLLSATTPSHPAVHDFGAGAPRAKESLLSAALSLILPGAGQAYNGQFAKGVILAILYLGSMATILVMMVLTTLLANAACLFCLPAFILPMIVMIYAIYDAYDTAEKINNGIQVRDWL